MELVYSLSAVADDIWHEHFTPIIGEAQVDYMLDKFKNDKIFEYNISNMPYISEFISPGNFICKKYGRGKKIHQKHLLTH